MGRRPLVHMIAAVLLGLSVVLMSACGSPVEDTRAAADEFYAAVEATGVQLVNVARTYRVPKVEPGFMGARVDIEEAICIEYTILEDGSPIDYSAPILKVDGEWQQMEGSMPGHICEDLFDGTRVQLPDRRLDSASDGKTEPDARQESGTEADQADSLEGHPLIGQWRFPALMGNSWMVLRVDGTVLQFKEGELHAQGQFTLHGADIHFSGSSGWDEGDYHWSISEPVLKISREGQDLFFRREGDTQGDAQQPVDKPPQTLFLRPSCGEDLQVEANRSIELVYGVWGAQNEDLLAETQDQITVQLFVDGERVTGQRHSDRLAMDEVPCGSELAGASWLYHTVELDGLPAGSHALRVTFAFDTPITDGFDQNGDGQPDTYGPQSGFEQIFSIAAGQ